MPALPSTGSLPITANDDVEATINGYRWNFTPGSARTIGWSVSGSEWNHPGLESAETQADFQTLFDFIGYYIDVDFVPKGYFASTSAQTGYARAYAAGSDMNISFAYDGVDAGGRAVSDHRFENTGQTAFCSFPWVGSDASMYPGAAGDTWLNYNNPFIAGLDFEVGSDGFALVLHEVLHGLGLKHPHDGGGTGRPTYTELDIPFADRQWISVMSYDRHESGGDGAYEGSMPIAPMIMDVIALQYLYGESSGSAGNSTHDLSRYVGSYYNTLWDASGSDTLDASAQPDGLLIDLNLAVASNGAREHHVGYVTTLRDAAALQSTGSNPVSWTWLWGEYEDIVGSAHDDTLLGNELDNGLVGGAGSDILAGGAGNDWLYGQAGDDVIDGGTGIDVAVFDVNKTRASIAWWDQVLTVATPVDGTDATSNVERLAFNDVSVAFDMAGNAGVAALVLGAVFGPVAVNDKLRVGQFIDYLDAGGTDPGLVQAALGMRLGSTPSAGTIVDLLYTNVVGHAPSAAERGYYVGLLNNGSTTPAELGMLAATTDLNAAHIDLVGLSHTGLDYLPAG